MKTIIRTVVSAAVLFGLTTQARADDEAWAAVGGFIAGVITGSVIEHNSSVHTGISVSYGDPCHSHHRSGCGVCYPARSGYWSVERVRVWVPGCWEIVVNHCGDRVRVWKPGRFDYHQRKIWVAYDAPRHGRPYRDYDRYDRFDRFDRYDRRDYDRHDGYRDGDRHQDHDRGRDRRG